MKTPFRHQDDCVRNVMDHVKTSTESCVVDATVSFGKSFVIAILADKIAKLSDKRVIIICPDGNLAKQNSDELKEMGAPHSLFSASLGSTSTRHNIIVGTPISIRNKLSRFKGKTAAILIDEGDGITTSIKTVVASIKEHNPLCRVVGFTGTPYRTGEGYIYAKDLDGNYMSDDKVSDPYYDRLIHRTTTQELMDLGYLTPLKPVPAGGGTYKTAGLKANKNGDFKKADVDRAYHGHGRLTASIVADIIEKAEQKRAVMIFGATVQHCDEIMASLPPELSIAIHSKTGSAKQDMKDVIAGKYKYIVNVNQLTVGTNLPFVDFIAVCRKTGSARLLTQIIGRGIRLSKENDKPLENTVDARKAVIANGPKPYCLYVDYTEDNIETHFPNGDYFNPEIRATPKRDGELPPINAECETCGFSNEFSARPNPDELETDQWGYFVDLMGNQVKTEHGPMPAHFGRRCLSFDVNTKERCNGRWTSKECPHCLEPNDIAARYCHVCKGEIIDPNTKLTMDFKALKRDPTRPQCDKIIEYNLVDGVSKAGNEQWRVDIRTEYRKLSFWFLKTPKTDGGWRQLEALKAATNNLTVAPETVSYVKDGSKFWRPLGWNLKEDVIDG